jgi:hypothetical protein
VTKTEAFVNTSSVISSIKYHTQNAVLSCSIDSFYDVIATRHGQQPSPRRIVFGTRSDTDKAEHLCFVFQQLAIVPLSACTGQTKALPWEINNSASKDQ